MDWELWAWNLAVGYRVLSFQFSVVSKERWTGNFGCGIWERVKEF
jgi:hypothetical protein